MSVRLHACTIVNKFQWNLNQTTKIKESAFEIVDCKMSAIPFLDLSVQTLSSASPVSVQHLDSVFADG